MKIPLTTIVEPSPQIKKQVGTCDIMSGVFYFILPIWGLSIYKYGLSSLVLVAVTMLVCLSLDQIVLKLKNQKSLGVFHDYSALITGLLLGLTLPPSLPLWMAALGSVIAMTLGKHIFGGLGHNPFNPAIVGRVFLQISFTAPMTTWSAPWDSNRFASLYPSNLTGIFMRPTELDGLAGATPLGLFKFEGVATPWVNFIYDMESGSLGEVSPLLILILGGLLGLKNYLDLRIPISILTFTLVFSYPLFLLGLGPQPLFVITTGGFMLGAWFMATDMVSSPVTHLGVWAYGGLIAFLIVIIRIWGGMPEGVAFAILLGNAVTPLIHIVSEPKVFGTGRGAR